MTNVVLYRAGKCSLNDLHHQVVVSAVGGGVGRRLGRGGGKRRDRNRNGRKALAADSGSESEFEGVVEWKCNAGHSSESNAERGAESANGGGLGERASGNPSWLLLACLSPSAIHPPFTFYPHTFPGE